MRIFQNRPFAASVCLAVAVMLMTWQMESIGKAILIGLSLSLGVVLLVCFLVKRRLSRLPSLLLLAACLTAVLLTSSFCFFNLSVRSLEKLTDREIEVEGYVVERLESYGGQSRFSVKLHEIDGERVSQRVLVEVSERASFQAGDRIRLRGAFRSPQSDHTHREDVFLYTDGHAGIFACESDGGFVLEGKENALSVRFTQGRDALSHRLRLAIGGEEGALAAALLLGDCGYLSEDTVLAFRRAGVSHLLALSGLHVSILIGLLSLLLFWVPKRWRMLLLPILAPLYLLLTGCSPSAARAVLMALALCLGLILQRRYDSFTGLSIALFVILILWPNAILSTSLWLSFSAAAAIVILTPPLGDWIKQAPWMLGLPRWLRRCVWGAISALLVGLCAIAGVLPLSAYLFGSVSVLSVPVTLLLSPLVTLSLWSAPFVLLLPRFAPFSFVCRLFLKGLLHGVETVSDHTRPLVFTDGLPCMLLLGLLVLSILGLAILKIKRRGWLLLPIALSACVLLTGALDRVPVDRGLGVTYLRKDHNEVILLTEGKGAVAVILSDGSADTVTPLLDALTEARCTELSQLILPRYPSRATYLLARMSGEVKVHELLLAEPRNEEETALAARLEQEARLHGIAVRYGIEKLAIEDVEISSVALETESAPPVRLLMKLRGQTVVYLGAGLETGDAFALSRNLAASADRLILGAHGADGECHPMPYFQARQVICGDHAAWGLQEQALSEPIPILLDPIRYSIWIP